MKKFIITFLLILFCSAILTFSLRGNVGNPTREQIGMSQWKDEGPFELSPERGRFALIYSIVEDKSLFFDTPIARFATPDLGYKNGKYVSLFAPGVSILLIPGYIIGKYLGAAQVGVFAIVSLFAILNVLFIRSIAIKLGANNIAATIASMIFLFATPAFPYAVTLYQHHISTFLILLCIFVLLKWKNLAALSIVWFLIAASVSIDYPNAILMIPIAVFASIRMFFVNKKDNFIKINFRLIGIVTFITIIFPLIFFLWFNNASYGNPFQLSGTIKSIKGIDEKGNPLSIEALKKQQGPLFEEQDINRKKTATGFFKSRNLINGFYTHFVSPDRGIVFYTPVILIGFIGMVIMYKKQKIMLVLIAIVFVNILLYSMWGDPWGGWAFGSRYLIPSYAILSIFIAFMITNFRKKLIILMGFYILLVYSISVNTLGAITSNKNPPKNEILALESISHVQEKYTYERNYDYLNSNRSKSFIFQTFVYKYLSAKSYYLIIVSVLVLTCGLLITYLHVKSKKENP